MRDQGSAKIETLEESGYKVVSCLGPGRYALLSEDGKTELWYGHKTPPACYCIKYGPWFLEFVSSSLTGKPGA